MASDTPTDGRCNYEHDDGTYCEGHPMDNGRCYHHGGKEENGGAPEGNNNAVTVAAWAEDFVTDFLRDDEIDRVKDFAEIAGEPESAQEAAGYAAGLALEQFRRTGDGRFLRRYESIMDTFNLAPDDEMNLNVDAEHTVDSPADFVTYTPDDEADGDDE